MVRFSKGWDFEKSGFQIPTALEFILSSNQMNLVSGCPEIEWLRHFCFLISGRRILQGPKKVLQECWRVHQKIQRKTTLRLILFSWRHTLGENGNDETIKWDPKIDSCSPKYLTPDFVKFGKIPSPIHKLIFYSTFC